VTYLKKSNYTFTNMKNSLASTNPYLALDPAKLAEAIRQAATSSTAIEGVHIDRYKMTLRKRARQTKRSS